MTFDRRQTNIAKGLAVLLLLWHHLFYNNPDKYNDFTSLFNFNSIPVECFLADFCKVCVAIFLVLSGYGLYKSFEKYSNANSINGKLPIKKQLVFVKNHLLKLMFGYWIIYIIFVPIGLFLGRPFYAFYGYNIFYYFADFFGLANLFKTPTINSTWWYMSIVIVFYIVFPLIYKLEKYSAELMLLLSFSVMLLPLPVPGILLEYKLWLFPFAFGIYLSKYNVFERAGQRLNKKINSFICCFIMILLCGYIRYVLFDMNVEFDAFFAFAIILVSYLIISKIPIVSKVLEELGKYSASIFMFHTFIYSYYFKDLIYWFKYSVVIFVVLTVVCYTIARLLEWLKHILRFNELVSFVCR